MLGGDSAPCTTPVRPPHRSTAFHSPPQGQGAARARPEEGMGLVSYGEGLGAGVGQPGKGTAP